jgi:hypothetical protein
VTAPTGGALTVNGTAASAGGSQSTNSTGSFPINLRTDYNADSQSGVASSTLTRRQAPIGSSSCGSFGSPTTISGAAAQSNLAEGCYLYTLTGTDRVGNAGSISTTVVVDKTPPALALGFPSNNGLYNTSSWNSGCSGAICGTASDRTGVAQVQLSLQRLSNGLYWNGSSFSTSAQTFFSATVDPSGGQVVVWGLSFPASNFPADGQYSVRVRGTDAVGNMTAPASYLTVTFTIDRTAPPAPSITEHPANPTNDKNAHFKFTDTESGVSFICKLDGGSYSTCNGSSGSANYSNLATGSHTFCVEAVDQAGNFSGATCFSWQIGAGLQNFTMSGSPLAGVKLYPGGAPVPVDLVFTNPNAVPITIQSVTVAIASVSGDTPPGACPASGNFSVAQQLVVTPALVVPANSTRSLDQLDPDQSHWPQLQMTDSGNQNACQNATVNLSFSGTAQG